MVGTLFVRTVRQPGEVVIFWSSENWARPFHFIPHDFLVYDSIDPCFSEDADEIQAFAARESETVRAADLVFASASSLFDDCKKDNDRVFLLNNACEPADYTCESLAAANTPSWWSNSKRAIVAYLGTLDWRFDFELVGRICELMPEVQFVFAGAVVPACEDSVARLSRLPNVICPGRISIEEGQFLLAACNVGLIPFRSGVVNDAVNPVKLYTYSLLGKPVVGTPIRELVDRPEIVSVSSDPQELVEFLERAIMNSSSPNHQQRLRSFALEQTWAHRAEAAWERIIELVLGTQDKGKAALRGESPLNTVEIAHIPTR